MYDIRTMYRTVDQNLYSFFYKWTHLKTEMDMNIMSHCVWNGITKLPVIRSAIGICVC